MIGRRGGSACAVAVLVLSGVSAPSAMATVADGAWALNGSISAPARSATNVTATLTGSADITQGLFNSAGCTDPNAPAQAHIQLQNSSTNAFVALNGTGLVTTTSGTTTVSATSTVAPGSYTAVVRVRCGDTGAWGAAVGSTPPVSINIASLVSTRSITRACRPTVPDTACTSASEQITGVPVGLTANFGAATRQTWSDGVVTETAVSGTQRLESAAEGSSTWTTLNSTSCSASAAVTTTRQYRCVASSVVHEGITVTAMPNTTNVSLGAPSVTPASAMRGDTITLVANVSMTYADGSSWPAPTDVQYRVEYQASGSDRWVQIAGPFALDARGRISRGVVHPGGGKLRVISGTVASAPTDLVEATPQTTYTWSNVSFPVSVPSRGTLAASARVQQAWTDGVQRNPADGTAVEVQFATAYSTLDTDLQWRTVGTVTTSAGNVSVRMSPLTSGFWRLKLGTAMTTPAFVQLTGSSPLQFSASVSVPAGEKPFAGRTTRYTITSGLSGYAGGSTLELWLVLGSTNFRVGSYYSNTTLSGTYSITAPETPGVYTPRFDLKAPGDVVVASSTGTAITVDGYTSILPVPTLPAIEPLQGDRVTLPVKLIGTTLGGQTEELDWSGRVELQRFVDEEWKPLAIESWASGKTVNFSFVAERDLKLRVFSHDRRLAGPTFTPPVAGPTGSLVFAPVNVSSRIVKGESVQVSVSMQSLYSNGKLYDLEGPTDLVLQSKDQGVWTAEVKLTASDGSVSTTLSPSETRTYRFFANEGSVSAEFTVTVITAGDINVTWSPGFTPGRSLPLTLTVRASDGGAWTRSERVEIQYLAPGSTEWDTIATASVDGPRGGSTTIAAPRAGSYRARLASTGATVAIDVPRPTGAMVLSNVTMSATRVQQGDQVTVSGALLLPYTDGKIYPAWGPRRVALVLEAGTEGIERSHRFTGSRFTIRTTATASGTFRVELPDGTSSQDLPIQVAYPELDVTWPEQVSVTTGLIVRASVKASDGRNWTGVVRYQLQYRPNDSSRWQNKAVRSIGNGLVVQLVARSPRPGEYRVLVPALAVEEARTYASG